ncbi:hypothetical protein AB0N14_18870 [Streptomyces sp. NPDC051104]|uniref:hypothetical protein n=1 Tax=Streptomyces sp. NPDC051104 TaxID=3155044 RepID=UPI003438DF14
MRSRLSAVAAATALFTGAAVTAQADPTTLSAATATLSQSANVSLVDDPSRFFDRLIGTA